MIWFLALAVLGALIWLGRSKGRGVNEWRSAAGLIGVAACVAGAAMALRGAWILAAVLIAVGLFLSFAARRMPRGVGMSEAEARRILGVSDSASEADIQAAFRSQMRKEHPDRGGRDEVAARLNAARDRLIKRP